ncbi:hypothetical protein HMPREF9455_00605 [Dysgonomonas gadei ATCC BAA-286]|uniref:RteC protein n=3 Tax=Dysgonomonas TaxID=156973 RepID=F5IU38_9BACT|nr:hypothetical protein HMPREF9455_00605 [Dysgonomonas gadei ATCC BAA-286]MBF0649533.1 RteC domain-containing protein [Dysgonomonas sp. GY75]
MKAVYLVGLSMQVLEWRITTPNKNLKCFSENKFSYSNKDLLSYHNNIGSNLLNSNLIENPPPLYPIYPKTRITWTANKIDLIELIYAWEKVGCFNYGNVNIKEIVAYIEVVFNIDLGDYYGTFKEMRNRINRTSFLDKLVRVLNDRMDEIDRKSQ